MAHLAISTLPLMVDIDRSDVMQASCAAVAEALDVDADAVSATWTFFEPGSYFAAGSAPEMQPVDSHPPIIDVSVDDVYSLDTRNTLLTALADAFGMSMPIAPGNVRINISHASTQSQTPQPSV